MGGAGGCVEAAGVIGDERPGELGGADGELALDGVNHVGRLPTVLEDEFEHAPHLALDLAGRSIC